MTRAATVLLSLALGTLLLLSTGCGGGGGGGGDSASSPGGGNGDHDLDPDKNFFLTAATFARPIFDVNNDLVEVVNPASLFEVDPITGVPLPNFPKVLIPGTSLASLASINFEQILDPLTPQVPVIPRNGALILTFSQPIDASTLLLSDLDPEAPDQLTSASAVQIRHQDGSLVQARAFIDGADLILIGLTDGEISFEPSPLVFNTFGNAVEDPTGFLRVVTGVGASVMSSVSGLPLVPRPDKLGTVAVPLPINPGNSGLDAIVLQTETGPVSFNGYLPDLTPPRIIRPVEKTGTVSTIGFTSIGGQQIIEITGAPLSPPANVVANGGLGEWANARMDITGIGGVVTSYVVLRNYTQTSPPNGPVFQLVPGSVLDGSVAPGSAFHLIRSEFFEPVPPPLPNNPALLAQATVDPANHPRDPLDPQDLVNHDLRYFVRMFDETDTEELDRWNPTTGTFLAVLPKSMPQLTFSEPMDLASFRPYESFYVTDLAKPKTDPAFLDHRIGEVRFGSNTRSIRFVPFLANQNDPAAGTFIGFGGTASSLKLVIRTIPENSQIAALKANASAEQLAQLQDLVAEGVFGVNDLGGRGLGLPAAILDQGNATQFLLQSTSVAKGPFPPALDFQVAFQTLSNADPDYGAIIHRFMGKATTASIVYPVGSIHDSVTSGVVFADYPAQDTNGDSIVDKKFIYGPQVFDVGLSLPGMLTGAPAQSIEHLIDNFNPPKASPTSVPPSNEDKLAELFFGLKTPLDSPFGCRFQHIYRAGDASPAYNDFNGVVLDLVGLAWSPLNNKVTNTTISDMEILVGLSSTGKGSGPTTLQSGNGIPTTGESGLTWQFDCNLLEWAQNCCHLATMADELIPFSQVEPPQTTVVTAGTPYNISQSSLFKPQNAGVQGTFYHWLSYPTFNAGIDPIFKKPNTFSFPYDSRFPMLLEYRIKPAKGPFPSTLNFYRFSPGILSSALPQFRIWSQGQDRLANCVPNFFLGNPAINGGINCGFKAGEGGPLLEPGTFSADVVPPAPNNNMPVIHASTYMLPPFADCALVTGNKLVNSQLPKPDAVQGKIDPMTGAVTLPTCNTDPNTNWYYANGMLAYPLPNLASFQGPTGVKKSQFYGYGVDGFPVLANEPSYNCDPAESTIDLLKGAGDGSRYFMLWKYRKRVSIIESPTIEAESLSGLVEYHVPVIDPPLSQISAGAGLIVQIRASPDLTFSVPVLESGYINTTDPDFVQKVSGDNLDRTFVKFRANFAVAPGQLQPPFIDTIVIPFRKVAP